MLEWDVRTGAWICASVGFSRSISWSGMSHHERGEHVRRAGVAKKEAVGSLGYFKFIENICYFLSITFSLMLKTKLKKNVYINICSK